MVDLVITVKEKISKDQRRNYKHCKANLRQKHKKSKA